MSQLKEVTCRYSKTRCRLCGRKIKCWKPMLWAHGTALHIHCQQQFVAQERRKLAAISNQMKAEAAK